MLSVQKGWHGCWDVGCKSRTMEKAGSAVKKIGTTGKGVLMCFLGSGFGSDSVPRDTARVKGEIKT